MYVPSEYLFISLDNINSWSICYIVYLLEDLFTKLTCKQAYIPLTLLHCIFMYFRRKGHSAKLTYMTFNPFTTDNILMLFEHTELITMDEVLRKCVLHTDSSVCIMNKRLYGVCYQNPRSLKD